MTDQSSVSTAQATGIQARYTYNTKALAKALEAGDDAKIEMLQKKIEAIVSEAEGKGINLVDVEEDKPKPAATAAPKPSGKAKVQAKLAAVVKPNGKAPDPEAAAAMNALDKGKDKAAGKKAEPKPLKRTHDCLCGCGQETLSLFAPGHDARVKGILLKVERGGTDPRLDPGVGRPIRQVQGQARHQGLRHDGLSRQDSRTFEPRG
jgi:hypothetical protein